MTLYEALLIPNIVVLTLAVIAVTTKYHHWVRLWSWIKERG